MNSLPGDFVKRHLKMNGKEGRAWLNRIPALRDELRETWALSNPQPLPDLSYNYLEFARNPSGRRVVLKIGFPNPELETEIHALRIYQGRGAVKLLGSDLDKGALLLERITPGHNLLTVKDDPTATRIAGRVMAELWRPDPGNGIFPTLEKWCQGFERYQRKCGGKPGPLPDTQVQRAAGLAADLLRDQTSPTLLHGDLHQMNILQAGTSRWLAIDPKGVIGEKAAEVGPLLFNPIPDLLTQPDIKRIIRGRLDVLEEISGLDRSRMVAWSYVRALLSAIWTIEEGGNIWDYGLAFANLLDEIS